jgi:hypothetical protein
VAEIITVQALPRTVRRQAITNVARLAAPGATLLWPAPGPNVRHLDVVMVLGLDTFGITWIEIDDAEADDVIATLVTAHPGRDVLIASSRRARHPSSDQLSWSPAGARSSSGLKPKPVQVVLASAGFEALRDVKAGAASATPVEVLLEEYRCYLLAERGVQAEVARGYLDLVGPFVAQHAAAGAAGPGRLSAADVGPDPGPGPAALEDGQLAERGREALDAH